MNKKGSIIVEAAMIFPLVFMSVMILIFMMIYFYSQLSERTDIHILLRSESGKVCDNMFYGNEVKSDFPVYKKAQQIYSEGTFNMSNRFFLNSREKQITARKYIIDESRFVRLKSLSEAEQNADEQ